MVGHLQYPERPDVGLSQIEHSMFVWELNGTKVSTPSWVREIQDRQRQLEKSEMTKSPNRRAADQVPCLATAWATSQLGPRTGKSWKSLGNTLW